MAIIKNALPPEAILNDKYHILMPIQKGGFSIIYLAESISDGMLVAVKELFNSDYMDRITPAYSISVRDNSCLSKFERDRKKFYDEWNIMNLFANCNGSVKPIAYFEENNTAYIVMEHLSGGSLKDNVHIKGPYKPNALLNKLDNVLSLLSKMHKNGFVHGDISPDNLVMDSAGNYRIIDFGAVKTIGTIAQDDNLIRKKGYTPAELFNRKTTIDSRIDIYSFCAVLYYALTGTVPDDSLDRILFDELRPLSDMQPQIDTSINSLVMNGLCMNPNSRWKSIDEVTDLINHFYDCENKGKKKEKHNIQRRKRAIIGAIIASSLIFIPLALLSFKKRENLIRFHGKETQTIVFYYNENTSNQDKRKLKQRLANKIQILIGTNNFMLNDFDSYFKATFLYSTVQSYDIASIINKYFNYSYCEFGYYESGNVFSKVRKININDIQSARVRNGECLLKPNTNLLNDVKNCISNNKLVLRVHSNASCNHMWDHQNTPYDGLFYDITLKFDSDAEELICNSLDTEERFGSQLLVDCLTHDCLPIESFNYTRHIIWEDLKDNTWGRNQTLLSNLERDEILILDYLEEKGPVNNTTITASYEANNNEADDSWPLVKKRLDLLGVPYACGIDFNKNELYIAFNPDHIMEFEAAVLFGNNKNNSEMAIYTECEKQAHLISFRSASGITLPYPDDNTLLVFEKNCITVQFEDTDTLKDRIKQIKELNDKYIYLCVNERPLSKAPITNIVDSGKISFKELILDNSNSINNAFTKEFIYFINDVISEGKLGNYYFSGSLYISDNTSYDWDKDVWDMSGSELRSQKTDICEYISTSGLADASVSCAPSSPSHLAIKFTCEYLVTEKRHPYDVLEKMLNQIEWTSEITDIYFEIQNLYDSTTYYLRINRSPSTGQMQIIWDFSDNGYDNNSSENKYEIAAKYFINSPLFFDCQFYPAITSDFEDKDIILLQNDNTAIRACFHECFPGKKYEISYMADNRSKNQISVTLEKACINNIVVDTVDNYIEYFSSESIDSYAGPSIMLTDADFILSKKSAFRNSFLSFRINDGKKEYIKDVYLSENKNIVFNIEDYNLSSAAKEVINTKEFCIYYLGYNKYENNIELILVNKTHKDLQFSISDIVVDIGYDTIDEYSPTNDIVNVFPQSLRRIKEDYNVIWEGKIDSFLLNVKVTEVNEDNNNLLVNEQYQIEN